LIDNIYFIVLQLIYIYIHFFYIYKGELKPLSCTGGQFDPIKVPLVTLIDTLDTLVIMGNFTEFRRAVELIRIDLPSFDLDVNVSVFEITIRMLGGLLAAHLFAGMYYIYIYYHISGLFNFK
jgi:hypothetical protein